MLKQPIYVEFNLDAKVNNSKLIAISHVDDKYSETLEVAVKQNDRFVYMGGASVIARMVLHREKDYLLSDNVPCDVNDNGNILIPFDNAVVKTLQGTVKIEVNITRDADELTLQFPLWVSVNGSILDNAEVTPESEGTIPDLLKEAADALDDAKEAMEQVGDYNNLENKPQIQINGTSPAPIAGLLRFNPYEFVARLLESGTIDINLSQNVFRSNLSPTSSILYDFDLLKVSVLYSGVYKILKADISNLPQEFAAAGEVLYVYHFLTSTSNGDLIRIVTYETAEGVKAWIQLVTLGASDADGNTQIAGASAWADLTSTGGSEIASGIVNQNGTISFYDADGNLLFTTTGASVIGPQGEPGTDYVLTAQDKTDIADIVLQELPTTEGILYGNASN